MFKGKRPGLFAMALRAGFVQARHRQSSGGFEYIAPVGIVALHAVHVILDQGMVVWQIKFGLNVEVALKTSRRIFARISDELPSAASRRDMLAARSMARFAACCSGPFQIVPMEPSVWACREKARNVRVTVNTRGVSNEHGAFDPRWFDRRAGKSRTGAKDQAREASHSDC